MMIQKINIGKFCGLYEVVTVDEDKTNYSTTDYPDTKIGGDNTNKKLFVSAKDSRNNGFGKIRNEEFGKEAGDRSNSKGQGKTQENNEFKKLKDEKVESGSKLRDACQTIYEKNSSDDSSDTHKNKSDAELFCSIKLNIS